MVLVTGATGILGRVIVLELLHRGKEVIATKRKSSDLTDVLHSYSFYTQNAQELFDRISWVDTDFEDIHSLENALEGVEEVYHCAAKVSFHPASRHEMFQTNIEGTKNLLYACENSGVRNFLFVSSMAVFDGLNEEGLVDENSDFNCKLNHSDYATSKHFSEMEVWRASAEGLNTVIINPGIIIGSGNWNSSSGELFASFEKYPYSMSGTGSYVDVRDVALIAVELMEKRIFGERFVVISETKKYSEIADYIRKKLSLSPSKVLPGSVLKLGYLANLLFGWIVPKLRMMNKVNLDSVTSVNYVSNSKIRTRLNFEFIPVEESIDFHIKNYIADKQKQK